MLRAVLVLVLLSYSTESSPQLPLQVFTLEELIPLTPDFYPEKLTVDWVSDNEYILYDPREGLKKFDANTGTFVILMQSQELKNLSGQSFVSFSKDYKYALILSNRKKVYRYSSIAEYSLYDLEKKTVAPLGKGFLQAVLWGAGHSLAYVMDNNVYYVADASQPHKFTTLTNEGIPGEIYFGVTDWIYEEEVFNAAEALWFSPNGAYLAAAFFDDTKVESVEYQLYGNPADYKYQYPEQISFKYPKAGRSNPVVGLRVFKVNEPSTDAWNIPAPADIVGSDHIISRVNWATDHNLLVLWLNRRQNNGVLVNCDLNVDKCNIIRQFTQPDGWIEVTTPFFDATGTKIVELEPQIVGGQRLQHATLFDSSAYTVENLTPVNATVTEVLGWRQATSTLYFIAAPAEAPWLRQLWASQGELVRCVSCKVPSCHCVTGAFSPGASHGLISCSQTNVPPKTFLFNAATENFNLLSDNRRLEEKLSRYQQPMALFNIIRLQENVYAHVKLTLPPRLTPGAKYPLVLRVYGGPATSRAKDHYDLEYYNTYLAGNRSFVVAAIDVRGSGAMGVDALFAVNNALGTVEVTDTTAAIRRLLELYPFIDPSRIGVWGWSYGGFATAQMLMQDQEKIITCGVSVAPVTSWLFYDTIYTERYMGLPQNNPSGYLHADLMAHAEKLRGRRFMLVHGSGDDNVHFQNSLQLAKVLQHADIDFEQISYTDENHSLLGVSRHFYHRLDRFWTECFKL